MHDSFNSMTRVLYLLSIAGLMCSNRRYRERWDASTKMSFTQKPLTLFCHLQARMKSEKNRQKAEEQFLKAAHTQRQELAQQRREEKKRAEKEKLMAEEDPDRARKLEVNSFFLIGLLFAFNMCSIINYFLFL